MLLCGGSGTRLWSLSREAYSEQFVRLHGIDGIGRALLVCNESLRFIAAEQLLQTGIDDAHIMHGPMRRNITPAIAATALQAQADGDDPLLLAWPSDHVIRDQGAFCAAVDIARAAAQTGDLVPFGITPRSAQTSYGYSRVDGAPSGSAQSVRAFIEKPALAQASEYLASGDYYWNSEMFQFRASRYLQELAALQPAMLAACRDAVAHAQREETIRRREVFRPWGSYDLIGAGRRFHGKRISVKPGATLSLQMHHHRVHWVVTSGTAKVTNGDQEYLLSESQSTYIALNVVHSLENPGKIALELIEIQCGAYLGEDDIVRLPDRYGRVETPLKATAAIPNALGKCISTI